MAPRQSWITMPVTTIPHRPPGGSLNPTCSAINQTPSFNDLRFSFDMHYRKIFSKWRLPPRERHSRDLLGLTISVSYLFKISANYLYNKLRIFETRFLNGVLAATIHCREAVEISGSPGTHEIINNLYYFSSPGRIFISRFIMKITRSLIIMAFILEGRLDDGEFDE